MKYNNNNNDCTLECVVSFILLKDMTLSKDIDWNQKRGFQLPNKGHSQGWRGDWGEVIEER